VASGLVRDLADLDAPLRGWLAARHPDRRGLRIDRLAHASAGLSNETILLDARWDAPEPGAESLVLRLPPRQATFPDADLAAQARVQTVVADAGLPTAVPVTLEPDPAWLGVPFLVMPHVDGRVGPQAPAFDRWLLDLPAGAQRHVAEGFVDLLASLHRIDPAAGGITGRLRGGPLDAEVAWWSSYLTWACDGDEPPGPVADLLAWCAARCPGGTRPASLLWGDPRVGNTILDPQQRIVAALDWDMAFVGPAEHDVAWWLGLDAVGAHFAGGPVPGYPTRAELVARYEAALGRPLADLDWFEVFALVRSIAVTVRQSRLADAAGVEYPVPPPDRNPVIGYTRALVGRLG